MLKRLFLFLSNSKKLQSVVMNWKIAKKISQRFIAGETIDEVIESVIRLNGKGFYATIDFLGEKTNSESDAQNSTQEIIKLIELIDKNQVKANVSIKLSQIGLLINEEFCLNNLARILDKGKETTNFIRIDMEDSSITDATLKVLFWGNKIFDGLGIVIQSYLFRSEKDVKDLISLEIPVRLVKGAYKEPKLIAYENKKDVDKNFEILSEKLLFATKNIRLYHHVDSKRIGKFPPFLAIGTHDENMISSSIAALISSNLPKSALEIQMLYGIRNDLQAHYLKEGYPVRIYLPYGTHWYPYFMRRLAERPANLLFLLKNLFR